MILMVYRNPRVGLELQEEDTSEVDSRSAAPGMLGSKSPFSEFVVEPQRAALQGKGYSVTRASY